MVIDHRDRDNSTTPPHNFNDLTAPYSLPPLPPPILYIRTFDCSENEKRIFYILSRLFFSTYATPRSSTPLPRSFVYKRLAVSLKFKCVLQRITTTSSLS